MDIQTTPTASWKLKPASKLEEIKQNLNFLVNTTLLYRPNHQTNSQLDSVLILKPPRQIVNDLRP